MESFKPHTKCRACSSTKLTKYLNLGQIPLSNNLCDSKLDSLNAETFPLEIMLCQDCGLSQLSIVVNPEKLFAHYVYRSSINKGYVDHCREMAKTLKERYGLDDKSFIIDIASNDGALLREFKEEIGSQVLGVDPAKNLAKMASEQGIPTIDEFWTKELSTSIKETCGRADIITATNVFAHVDDIVLFLEACKIAIKPTGLIIIECPYFPIQIGNIDYTQTYFEHLSYITFTPIYNLCRKIGLHVRNVETQDIHGGTIRFYLSLTQFPNNPDNIIKYIGNEEHLNLEKYFKWGENVMEFEDELYYNIQDLKEQDKTIAGFGASAKGNILLNTVGLNDQHLEYIVDETPEKQDKYSPGLGLKIVGMEELLNNPVDYLLILSYNFKDEIIKKVKGKGYKGKFIVPIPKFEIVD
jgi:hypothetical protein